MFIGLLMFGVYSSIMIIVLLNMLIAMMSNSYQYIAVSGSALPMTGRSTKLFDLFRIQRKQNGSLPGMTARRSVKGWNMIFFRVIELNYGSAISKKEAPSHPRSISYPVLNRFGTGSYLFTGASLAVRRNIWETDGRASRYDTFRTLVRQMLAIDWKF